ncbi:MAG: ATP-binding cassette domain-containing protein [Deltaproteobacteria bacterium]|nr:ATP-binding cassette domain-containing protein [Deltaproteobacteria bacterium]
MPDNSVSHATTAPVNKLDKHALLATTDILCGANKAAASLLRTVFKRLVANTKNWSKQAKRLDHLGLAARYVTGPLREALLLPGDLALLQIAEDSFMLLHRHEGRWLLIGPDGSPLPDAVDVDSDVYVEAVVMRMPLAKVKTGGFASLTTLWPELRAAWAEVGIASLFINAGQLLLPLFSLLVYDKIAQNGLFETLWALTFGMALYIATDTGMRLVRSWSTERIGMDLTLRADESLWAKLVSQVDLPTGGFSRFISNYRDLTLSRDFVSSSYLLSVADIPFLLLYLTVIGIIAWPLMIVAILLVLLYAGVGLLMQLRINSLNKEAEQNNTRKLTFMGEVLSCLDVARTAPGSGAFLRRWRELTEQSASFDAKRRLAVSQMGMFSSVMQTSTTVVMLVAGVYLIHAQMMSTGKLIACTLLANRAMGMVASLFAVVGKWQDFQRAAARMESSLEAVVERDCTPRPTTVGHVAVIGLGKHYEGRPAALEAVSFSVNPGERIALLGRPGAGKSTLLRCIAGLCRADAGQILIDGLALDDIARFDRMRWMAYKPQDPEVFAGTLEDNLRIAGSRDRNRFSAAIWASGLESEFQSGRMSLGMLLNERGGNLSGGQRQKVALARVFAQSSRILLLDEPTLGLDPESERMLAERLPKLLDSSSVLIMTTHSAIMLSTVQRVVALDGGRVVADGPREKLVTIG